MELLDSHGDPISTRLRGEKGGLRRTFRLRIAEAAIREIEEHIAAGTVAPAHLRPLALACLGDVMWNSGKARDMRTAADVVRRWLADESGRPGEGSVTAIQVIVNPAPPAQALNGHANGTNGHHHPRLLEADGLSLRFSGD